MTNSLLFDLQQHDHLARRSELVSLGHSSGSIDLALRRGILVRPVKGWVATSLARRDAIVAVLHRGRLTDASALRAMGVWAGTNTDIHVCVPPNTPGSRARLLVPLAHFAASTTGRVVRHWTPLRFDSDRSWRTSAMDALVAFSKRESTEYATAAIESALFLKALPPRSLPALARCLPRKLQPYVPQLDGRSESGTETIARLRLAPLCRRIDIQVRVGQHRLDILIDGWLNVEIDSEEWHGQDRLANSRRDTWLVGQGYVVLRFDYQEVMYEWAACAAAVVATLSDPRRS